MSINKGWELCGDSAPRNLHSHDGGRGEQRWGPLICTNFYFLIFTLNCQSIVVTWEKVTLGTSQNIVYFLYFKFQGKRRFCYTTVLEKALLRGSFGFNFGGC